MEWVHEQLPYCIDDQPTRLDLEAIYSLLQSSYWAAKRSKETIQRSVEGSLCFGLYHRTDGQVGFMRVVTDQATFAFLCDVIIHPDHRGQGLGKWMIRCMLEHPALQGTSMLLGTKDAHGLYEKFGFQRTEMMRRAAASPG